MQELPTDSHHSKARTFSRVFLRGESGEGDPENRMCQGPGQEAERVILEGQVRCAASWGHQ